MAEQPTIEERKAELKLKEAELKMAQKILALQEEQTIKTIEKLQRIKAIARMDVVRECLVASAVNFLGGDKVQNPELDFAKALINYKDAVTLLTHIETGKLN